MIEYWNTDHGTKNVHLKLKNIENTEKIRLTS